MVSSPAIQLYTAVNAVCQVSRDRTNSIRKLNIYTRQDTRCIQTLRPCGAMPRGFNYSARMTVQIDCVDGEKRRTTEVSMCPNEHWAVSRYLHGSAGFLCLFAGCG